MTKSKLKVFFLFMLTAAAAPLFAQAPIAGMESLVEQVLDIFTGTITKIILICCLCGCAIAYAFNKDNEKMRRNILAIGIGVAILTAASEIVEWIMEAAG